MGEGHQDPPDLTVLNSAGYRGRLHVVREYPLWWVHQYAGTVKEGE